MKRFLLALALLLAPSGAWAQCNGVFSANTICGTVAGGIPGQVSTSVLTGAAGGTSGQIQFNSSGIFGGFTASGDATINTATGVITNSKFNAGTTFGSAAGAATGTSAHTIPFLDGNNTWSGTGTFSGVNTFSNTSNSYTGNGAFVTKPWADVTAYGATGNGVTDDTTAIQSAFTAAATAGICVYVPVGSYKITATLTGSLRCLIGAGYQGYGSSTYTGGVNTTQTTGWLGSTFVCSITINCISLVSNNAFSIQGIHIVYPRTSSAFSGVQALTLSSVAGSTNTNTGSVVRNVLIQGSDYGLIESDLYDFVFDNVNVIGGWIGGIQLNAGNNPSFGDSTIINSTFWGNGVTQYLDHIAVLSGGGIRVINNKFNFGGVNTICVDLKPSLGVAQSMEPVVIANNSCEGANVGIAFTNSNVANANISQVSITGNQIWVGSSAIGVTTNGAGQWINVMSVSGNTLMRNGGANVTLVTLDNMNDLKWGNNSLECSGGCTGNTTGVSILSHVTNSILGPDNFGPTIPFHYTSTSSVVIDDPQGMAFANLPGTVANGSRVFVTNGAPASTPCTGASTGSTAFRQNGAWKCF